MTELSNIASLRRQGCQTDDDVVLFNSSDSHDCLRYIAYWSKYNFIAFVGDSRIRNLYFSFIKFIGNDVVATQKAHSDLHFHDDKMNVHVVSILNYPAVSKFIIVFW